MSLYTIAYVGVLRQSIVLIRRLLTMAMHACSPTTWVQTASKTKFWWFDTFTSSKTSPMLSTAARRSVIKEDRFWHETWIRIAWPIWSTWTLGQGERCSKLRSDTCDNRSVRSASCWVKSSKYVRASEMTQESAFEELRGTRRRKDASCWRRGWRILECFWWGCLRMIRQVRWSSKRAGWLRKEVRVTGKCMWVCWEREESMEETSAWQVCWKRVTAMVKKKGRTREDKEELLEKRCKFCV